MTKQRVFIFYTQPEQAEGINKQTLLERLYLSKCVGKSDSFQFILMLLNTVIQLYVVCMLLFFISLLFSINLCIKFKVITLISLLINTVLTLNCI